MYLLSYGMIIGFSIGIIFGPIAVLCIRRSIIDGFGMGIATGFGAALAHVIFGSIAAFSLTAIKNILISQGILLRLLGSTYLLYLAFKAATKKFSAEQELKTMSYPQTVISTFLLNLTNPVVITSYAAFFTMFNVSIISMFSGIQLLFGIFVGNFSVWVALSGICIFLHSYSSIAIVTWVNYGAAILLATLGTIGIGSSLYALFTS